MCVNLRAIYSDMIEFDVGYETQTSNIMSFTLHGMMCDRHAIPCIHDEYREFYCQSGRGCKGKSGGCPPHSPYYEKIKTSKNGLYVMILKFDYAWAIKYSGWKSVYKHGSNLAYTTVTPMVYANRLTENYVHRIMRKFRADGYYPLGLGNCSGCQPSRCTVMTTGKCAKPDLRTYSMESVGIHCGVLHEIIFREFMPWWFRTDGWLPKYLYRYFSVFADRHEATKLGAMLVDMAKSDKSYHDPVPLPFALDTEIMIVPDDYFMYDDISYWIQPEYEAVRLPFEEIA